jgi:hypothetical protein
MAAGLSGSRNGAARRKTDVFIEGLTKSSFLRRPGPAETLV